MDSYVLYHSTYWISGEHFQKSFNPTRYGYYCRRALQIFQNVYYGQNGSDKRRLLHSLPIIPVLQICRLYTSQNFVQIYGLHALKSCREMKKDSFILTYQIYDTAKDHGKNRLPHESGQKAHIN